MLIIIKLIKILIATFNCHGRIHDDTTNYFKSLIFHFQKRAGTLIYLKDGGNCVVVVPDYVLVLVIENRARFAVPHPHQDPQPNVHQRHLQSFLSDIVAKFTRQLPCE